MSTNIHIYGERDILVIKTQKTEVQTIKFEGVYQTSTKESYMIMESPDRVHAYKDIIMSKGWAVDEEVPVYADDDIFGEHDPIDTKIVNSGKEHIQQFDEWLKMCSEEGYDVYFEAW